MRDERELADLVVALRQCRPEAWDQLYQITHLSLLRLLRRWLADDARAEEALQATFVAAIESFASFDPLRGTVDGWLCGIARYQAIAIARVVGRTDSLEIDPPGPTADSAAVDAEMVALALDQLEPRYAEVLRRKYLLGESLNAISRGLGLKVATVGTLLHRARDQFREAYGRLHARAEAS
jgi:RNA polymerase sigma-70 factor (ECF subfamily)